MRRWAAGMSVIAVWSLVLADGRRLVGGGRASLQYASRWGVDGVGLCRGEVADRVPGGWVMSSSSACLWMQDVWLRCDSAIGVANCAGVFAAGVPMTVHNPAHRTIEWNDVAAWTVS